MFDRIGDRLLAREIQMPPEVGAAAIPLPISGTTAAIGSMDVLLVNPPPAGQPPTVAVLPPPSQTAFGYEITEYDSQFATVLPLLSSRARPPATGPQPGGHTTSTHALS